MNQNERMSQVVSHRKEGYHLYYSREEVETG